MAERGKYAVGGPFAVSDATALVRKPNYHYPEDERIAELAIAKHRANPDSALTGIVEELVVAANLQRRVMLDSHVRRIMRRIAKSHS